MLLRDSPHKGNLTYAGVRQLGAASEGNDPAGYRLEFLELVGKAEELAGKIKLKGEKAKSAAK